MKGIFKRSPVIDVTTGPPGVASNGTTSTAIPYLLDQNQENGLFRLDAGFHYWGWNYRFPAEITVKYGQVEITDGDSQPSQSKGTDFETVYQGMGGRQRIFTIYNDHQTNYLGLGTITLPVGFSLADEPAQAIAPQSSDTFTI